MDAFCVRNKPPPTPDGRWTGKVPWRRVRPSNVLDLISMAEYGGLDGAFLAGQRHPSSCDHCPPRWAVGWAASPSSRLKHQNHVPKPHDFVQRITHDMYQLPASDLASFPALCDVLHGSTYAGPATGKLLQFLRDESRGWYRL